MPELIWKGKEQVINHHLEVPVRCLDRRSTYNAEESENRIIHGDNLEGGMARSFFSETPCFKLD